MVMLLQRQLTTKLSVHAEPTGDNLPWALCISLCHTHERFIIANDNENIPDEHDSSPQRRFLYNLIFLSTPLPPSDDTAITHWGFLLSFLFATWRAKHEPPQRIAIDALGRCTCMLVATIGHV